MAQSSNVEQLAAEASLLLHEACRQNCPQMLKKLLEMGGDKEIKDAKGYTPLNYSVSTNKLECAQVLLEAGAKIVQVQAYDDLQAAIACRSAEMIELLVQHGAKVNFTMNSLRRTPLHIACCAAFVVVRNGSRRLNGQPFHLIRAEYRDHVTPPSMEVIKKLIWHGANLTAKDTSNLTPLDYLSEEQRSEVIAWESEVRAQRRLAALHFICSNFH